MLFSVRARVVLLQVLRLSVSAGDSGVGREGRVVLDYTATVLGGDKYGSHIRSTRLVSLAWT